MGPAAVADDEIAKNYPGEMSREASISPEPSPAPTHDRTRSAARQQVRSIPELGSVEFNSTKSRPIKPVKVETGSGITQINKLSDKNWVNWREDIVRMLGFLKVKEYLFGHVPRPDPFEDPEGTEAWDHNDSYALHLISLNLSESQKIHISRKTTASSAWNALLDIHEAQDHDTITSWMKSLFQTVAGEGTDIPKHIKKLLGWYERIILANDPEFSVTDTMFKSIITNSLPPSWHAFTKPYVRRRTGIPEIDYETRVPSSKLIGIIIEEYEQQQSKRLGNQESSLAVNAPRSKFKGLPRPSLKERINPSLKERINEPNLRQRISPNSKWCDICKTPTHNTQNCRNAGTNPCGNCGKYGHSTYQCWSGKRKLENNITQTTNKKPKREITNVGEDAMEIVSTARDDSMNFDPSEEGQHFNFDVPVSDMSANDDRLIYYNWLADSATTSHVTNQRDAFIDFTPLTNKLVIGVGNNKAHAIGRGTVELESKCNNRKFIIKLEDVLYIPDTPNSLISLGRWDRIANGVTNIKSGIITLSTKDGIAIAKGEEIGNFLYRLNVFTRKPNSPQTKNIAASPQTFMANEPAQSWETWHRRFGHINYYGLQKLYNLKLVNGFNVDTRTAKPDCIACTEAKQHVKPFNKEAHQESEPGELTHIDLWGKYAVRSIQGNYYYVVLVDDASRRVAVHYLKEKNQAARYIKNYLATLITQGRKPKAIRVDRGKEFLSDQLKDWCEERGIEIQLTAPYSPSQNGIAERMNRTLVELARAMRIAADLPEYLWESAITHAAYLRNRSFSSSINTTPYQIWYNKIPNISHLREFGAPVWILLQGQHQDRKLQPKSKRQAFTGFDDGSNSVLYYNAETHNILTSRNFRFLTVSQPSPSEEIEIMPHSPHEGEENKGNMSPNAQDVDRKGKRKRIEPDLNEPRKTRQKRVDYKQLNDPFPADLDDNILFDDNTLLTADIINAIIEGDEIKSLNEAKRSADWLEWEKAMKMELKQLHEMNTWELIDKPLDAIPITNKWVFIRKRNKIGEVVKYKARLVARGYSQRPGQDYNETYSPVVRMDTLRAILALVPVKRLKIQQMDIKGAYLNGILKENIYMEQPEGFNDGTGKICHLIKTLYGLKQSGREWNKALDIKLIEFGFSRLTSDPCVYIKWEGDEISIITVWVDDLLLFSSSDELMIKTKNYIKSVWEVTDIGEPNKIVGIEITINENSISISQQKYVENILRQEHMIDANPVGTPLDPNIQIGPNPDGNQGNRSNSYARLLGELQWVANVTRPDITYAINKLATYTANPSLQHVGALKRVLRYLAGTKNLGITYSRNPYMETVDMSSKSTLFHGYADAAYANTDDLKSTLGYVFLSSGGAITWRSKKQTTRALSSTEAEYIALSEAGREICWLRALYHELGFPQNSPTILKGDNNGSIAMVKNPQFHQRSKHIDIRYHWIRDQIAKETIDLESCRDPDQTADILTKALPRPKHQKHVNDMGLAKIAITEI